VFEIVFGEVRNQAKVTGIHRLKPPIPTASFWMPGWSANKRCKQYSTSQRRHRSPAYCTTDGHVSFSGHKTAMAMQNDATDTTIIYCINVI
jgi:hypothetical protein